MRTADKKLIDGYAEMVQERLERGFTPTLLSFMFRELGGSAAGKQQQMRRAVERTYARHLTHIWRRPDAKDLSDLPLWFGTPDRPVFKHFPDHLANIVINDGLHMPMAALTPPASRLGTSLEGHIDDHQSRYFPACGLLHRIHATEVTETPDIVVGYVMKSVPRGRCGGDELLVLPRTRSEMGRLTRAERQAERESQNALRSL